MQTADLVQKCRQTVPRLICENISSKNILSVTQLPFCGHLSRELAFLWTIPCSFPHILCLKRSGPSSGYLSAAYLIWQLTCQSERRLNAECEDSG